ncbi:hypothetical protein H6H03_25755 [Nostoc paludosum FACHB-159]|uniref:Uncharacterized protein n=1 Tax=Nostoc paludosum FACHB-159 TaxID=2692908 RepID=A0ABR8KG19_9NOSO|nr:hypothetical protein [Nostoc paludosum FACHB-159]
MSPHFPITRISHKFEMQRGTGVEGKEQGTLNSPLLKVLRDVVRNPAISLMLIGEFIGTVLLRNMAERQLMLWLWLV